LLRDHARLWVLPLDYIRILLYSILYQKFGQFQENKAKIAYGPETGCVTCCCLQATCTAINTFPRFRRLCTTVAMGRHKRCNRRIRGTLMKNIVTSVCANYDRFNIDKALRNFRKSDNKHSPCGPVSVPKMRYRISV